MNLLQKFLFFLKNFNMVINAKMGDVIEISNDCYQIPKILAWFFRIYYSGIVFVPILSIWVFFSEFFSKNIYIQLIFTFVLYFFIDFILTILIIPFKKNKCWKIYTIGKNKTK